jgi:hypothetical protein
MLGVGFLLSEDGLSRNRREPITETVDDNTFNSLFQAAESCPIVGNRVVTLFEQVQAPTGLLVLRTLLEGSGHIGLTPLTTKSLNIKNGLIIEGPFLKIDRGHNVLASSRYLFLKMHASNEFGSVSKGIRGFGMAFFCHGGNTNFFIKKCSDRSRVLSVRPR